MLTRLQRDDARLAIGLPVVDPSGRVGSIVEFINAEVGVSPLNVVAYYADSAPADAVHRRKRWDPLHLKAQQADRPEEPRGVAVVLHVEVQEKAPVNGRTFVPFRAQVSAHRVTLIELTDVAGGPENSAWSMSEGRPERLVAFLQECLAVPARVFREGPA